MGFEEKFYSKHKSLSLDDVLIQPSDISRVESRIDPNLQTKISKNITIPTPIIASPMDMVVNLDVIKILNKVGAAGCFHRFQSSEEEYQQVQIWTIDKERTTPVIAAISAHIDLNSKELERVELLASLVDVFILDTAMGTNIKVLKSLEFLKKRYPNIDIIAGNIVTAEGALTLINAGADGIRAGIGNGSNCITRVQTGVGRGQLTTLIECSDVCKKYGVSLISDGGVEHPGQLAKALAAGADVVMMGRPIAGHWESPGPIKYMHNSQNDFLDVTTETGRWIADMISPTDPQWKAYKVYRGMASKELQEEWRGGVKNGTTYEGIQTHIPVRGYLEDTLNKFLGGLRSSMSYCDSFTIQEFHNNAKFERLTAGSHKESYDRPHY